MLAGSLSESLGSLVNVDIELEMDAPRLLHLSEDGEVVS